MASLDIKAITQALKQASTTTQQRAIYDGHKSELNRASWDDLMDVGYPEFVLNLGVPSEVGSAIVVRTMGHFLSGKSSASISSRL